MVRSAFPLTEWKEEASEMRKLFRIWAALGMNIVPVSLCVCVVLVNMDKFTRTNPKHKSGNQINSRALALLFPLPCQMDWDIQKFRAQAKGVHLYQQ